MSRRLWVTAIVLMVAVAAVIVLSFIAWYGQVVPLSVAVLICLALAVVALQYIVVRPAQIEAAKRDAYKYCAAGEIIDPGLHKRLCDRLDSAPGDAEAVRLRQQLDELNKTGTKND
jgi:hypothetical protein